MYIYFILVFQVSLLFYDASLGNSVNINIVKLLLLDKEQVTPLYFLSAEATLYSGTLLYINDILTISQLIYIKPLQFVKNGSYDFLCCRRKKKDWL